VVYLGDRQRIELPIPRRALSWLKDRVDEIEKRALKVRRTVRVQWREDKDPKTLKVQIVLRVQRPRPPQPDPKEALLCFIDVNSAYSITAVIATYEEGRVKVYETPKFRPPNQSRRLRETAKRERAAAYGSNRTQTTR